MSATGKSVPERLHQEDFCLVLFPFLYVLELDTPIGIVAALLADMPPHTWVRISPSADPFRSISDAQFKKLV